MNNKKTSRNKNSETNKKGDNNHLFNFDDVINSGLELNESIHDFKKNIENYSNFVGNKNRQNDISIQLENIKDDNDVLLNKNKILRKIKSQYKIKVTLQYLESNNKDNKQKLARYNQLKIDLFKYLYSTNEVGDDFYIDIKKEQNYRNIITKNIKKTLHKIWKHNFFDLFYTFDFSKLSLFFKDDIYSVDITNDFNDLIQKHEWSLENESFMYDKYKITQNHTSDYLIREKKYVLFIKKITLKFINTLLYEYKKIHYKKSFIKNNIDIKAIKNEIYTLIKICNDKSYDENRHFFSPKQLAKANKIKDPLLKENYFFKILQFTIYKLMKNVENINIPRQITKNTKENIIDVVNCSKIYSSKDINVSVIKDLNLSIKKGEFILLLGASGSGKTTLMNMMSGMDSITWGDIVVNNVNLSLLNNRDLTLFRKNNIGYIFQRYALIPNLTVAENVRMGAYVSNCRNIKKFKRSYIMSNEEVEELLNELDLKGCSKKYPYELSGGQQQRVSIARAIAKKPKIIFADEPTSALDENSSKRIIDILKNINKKYKITIVMITHNEKVTDYATRKIYLKEGKIIKDVKEEN